MTKNKKIEDLQHMGNGPRSVIVEVLQDHEACLLGVVARLAALEKAVHAKKAVLAKRK